MLMKQKKLKVLLGNIFTHQYETLWNMSVSQEELPDISAIVWSPENVEGGMSHGVSERTNHGIEAVGTAIEEWIKQ